MCYHCYQHTCYRCYSHRYHFFVIIGNVADPREHVNPAAERILRAATDLLQKGGIEAVSTRAVAAAAGVQPPTIYRQYGDKNGLLDAVVSFALQGYVKEKRLLAENPSDDPANDLRRLWDLHVEFGMEQPDCYVLAYGPSRPEHALSAATETIRILTDVIARLADQGRLRMSVERASTYFRSCGTGFVLTQIGAPPAERDPALSSIMFEDMLGAISNDANRERASVPELPGRAGALREALRDKKDLPLTHAEHDLLGEWLKRLADGGS
jgi:AcrR family transcriptional regulator